MTAIITPVRRLSWRPPKLDSAHYRLEIWQFVVHPIWGFEANASQRKRIAERYATGETMAELARKYECSEPMLILGSGQ